MRPLVLILSKMREYVQVFKAKDGDKDKSNTLMFLHINVDRLLEK